MKTKTIAQHIALVISLGLAASAHAQLLGRGGPIGGSIGGLAGGAGSMGGHMGAIGAIGQRDSMANDVRPASSGLRRSADAHANGSGNAGASGSAGIVPALARTGEARTDGSGSASLAGNLIAGKPAAQPAVPDMQSARSAATTPAGAANAGQPVTPDALPTASAREVRGGSVRGTIGAVRSAAAKEPASEPASAGGNPAVDKQLALGASAGGANAQAAGGANPSVSASADGSRLRDTGRDSAAAVAGRGQALATGAARSTKAQLHSSAGAAKSAAGKARGTADGVAGAAASRTASSLNRASGAVGSAAKQGVHAQASGSVDAGATAGANPSN